MIMNGVCCVCIGYVNLSKLDGTARLEFDPEYARVRYYFQPHFNCDKESL